jgi:hypothetical protein
MNREWARMTRKEKQSIHRASGLPWGLLLADRLKACDQPAGGKRRATIGCPASPLWL